MSQESLKKKYKYHEEHSKLSCDCPVENEMIDFDSIAFRFVHKNTNHPNCKLPNLKIHPNRKYNSCDKICGAYALSFYISLDHAKASYDFLSNTFPTFKDTVGEYIAECKLTAEDGKSGAVGTDGHFNFHEFEETDLTSRFINLVKALP